MASAHGSTPPLQPPNSSYQPPSVNKPSSQTSQPEPLRAIVIPPKHSSASVPFGNDSVQSQPSITPSTGYRPPPMQPQVQKQPLVAPTSGLDSGDIDFLAGLGTGRQATPFSHSITSSSGWSSGILEPTSSAGLTGQAGMQRKGSPSGGGVFNGMQMTSSSHHQTPLQPATVGMFAGMQVSPPQSSYSGNVLGQPSPLTFQTQQQPLQPQSLAPSLAGATREVGPTSGLHGGLSQPLVPTPGQGGGGSTGWSMASQSGGGMTVTGQQHQMQGPMGWSSNIARSSQQVGVMGGGLDGSSGLGLGAGNSWSSNVAGRGGDGGGTMHQASGMGGQPTAVGLMMGGGSLLAPMVVGATPQNPQAAYSQQPSQYQLGRPQHPSSQPAPGDNPFADLSFLD